MIKKQQQQSSLRVLGVFALAMIAISGIFSLRNMPLMAEYGLSAIVLYLLAAVIFFIPTALVCAELATAWPERGGLYTWVREAFGPAVGFLAIWFEWTNTVVWFPMLLSFISATLAFVINPHLANNRFFILTVILSIYWLATIVNFFGMRMSSWLSSLGIIFGTLLPGLLIIGLGIGWLLTGKPAQISFTWSAMLPHLHLSGMVFFVGFVLSFAGMQVVGFHARETQHPQRDFPRAIFLATIVILVTAILGSLAIAIVVPTKQISLVAGLMQAFAIFLQAWHLSWLLPILALLTVFGAAAMLNTWIIGPSKGLLVSAQAEHLPKPLLYCNKHDVPVAILFLQGIIVTLLTSVFLFMPTVNSSYWILSALTAQLTMAMFVLLFAAVIRLRYTQPDKTRAYRIPGGKIGVWLVSGVGILVCVSAFALGFVPPEQLHTGSLWFYEGFLVMGFLLLALPPFIINYLQRTRM